MNTAELLRTQPTDLLKRTLQATNASECGPESAEVAAAIVNELLERGVPFRNVRRYSAAGLVDQPMGCDR